MGSWICGFRDGHITFKGLCILWRRRTCNHGSSFVPFHIRVGLSRHVELQNAVGALMDQPQEHELGILVV
jgi:hypothetical protein